MTWLLPPPCTSDMASASIVDLIRLLGPDPASIAAVVVVSPLCSAWAFVLLLLLGLLLLLDGLFQLGMFLHIVRVVNTDLPGDKWVRQYSTVVSLEGDVHCETHEC